MHKMEERPENMSKKEQAINISPSVIVLSEILELETDPARQLLRNMAVSINDVRICRHIQELRGVHRSCNILK